MTTPDLDELEALEKARTQGVWSIRETHVSDELTVEIDADSWMAFATFVVRGSDGEPLRPFSTEGPANAVFIAALANAAPFLIAEAVEARRLREENARLREALEHLVLDNEDYVRINKLHNADGTPAITFSMRQARAALSPAGSVVGSGDEDGR